jgi:hypothetical protein
VTRRAAAALVAAAGLAVAASPAHATLAYVRGALQGKPVLWVAADDGSGARALATGGFSPRVSPDGTQVAYVIGRRSATLKVRPVAGGPARTVATHVWNYDAIRWAPDGAKLSVTTGPELGPYRLKVADLATGATRTVARGFFAGASFAPTGGGLVFARSFRSGYPIRANLYTTAADGGAVHRITSDGNAGSPVWGPERIAFDRSRRASHRGDYDKLDIYTIRPDGSGIARMTRTHPPFLLAGLTPLAWSQDGTRLAAQYGGQDTSEAWRVNPQTGSAADATGAFDGVVGWGLSRDGSTLLATTGYYDNPAGDVLALAWDGGASVVLATRASQPSWSR